MMLFETEPEEWCRAAEIVVRDLWRQAWAHNVDRLEELPTPVIERLYDDGDWDLIAMSAIMSLEKRDMFDIGQVARFLAGKQHDYGPRNVLKFGHQGLAVRLWDKVARFSNLRKRGTEAKNEPLLDTFLDLLGYVVIDLMLKHDWFELPVDPSRLVQ